MVVTITDLRIYDSDNMTVKNSLPVGARVASDDFTTSDGSCNEGILWLDKSTLGLLEGLSETVWSMRMWGVRGAFKR